MSNYPDPHFSPKYCLVVEDHLASQSFFKLWVKKNYSNSETVLFDSFKKADDWIEFHRKKISNFSVLALVDIGLPDGSGLDIIKKLSSVSSSSKIIVITIKDDHETLFQALRNGAEGYILKHEEPIILKKILARITEGECPLSPSIAQKVINYFHSKSLPDNYGLTNRELDTLKLVTKGLTVKEAASQMKLSPLTVSGYVKIIYQKLHVSSRAEATQKAIHLGLV